MFRLILLQLLIVEIVIAKENLCYDRYPLSKTSEILEEIVKRYSTPKRLTDENGDDWLNNVIIEGTVAEINGTLYHLNSPLYSQENTFFFNSLKFSSVPTFVIPKNISSKWRPDHPDMTFQLHKISFLCPKDYTNCGLTCCDGKTQKLQEIFLQNGKLSEPVELNGIVYTTTNGGGMESDCVYHLGINDKLYVKKKVHSIFFKCSQPSSVCCSLTCLQPPQPMASHSEEKIATSFISKIENSLRYLSWSPEYYKIGCVVFFVIVILGMALNVWHSRPAPRPSRRLVRQSTDVETQTSRLSIYTRSSTEYSVGTFRNVTCSGSKMVGDFV